jgi:hypothetical protein
LRLHIVLEGNVSAMPQFRRVGRRPRIHTLGTQSFADARQAAVRRLAVILLLELLLLAGLFVAARHDCAPGRRTCAAEPE